MKKSKFLKALVAIAVGAVAVAGAFSFAACGGGEEAGTGNGTENPGTENPGNNPGNNPGTTPSTPTVHDYTYSYTALTTAMGITDDGTDKNHPNDKQAITQANLTTPNDFLKLGSGSVTWRCLKNATGGAIELKDEGLTVTFQGTGTITISFGSTSSSNTSGIALINSAGTYLVAESTTGTQLAADQTIADGYVNKKDLCTKEGGQKAAEAATVTYKITEAGTYTIYSSYSYIDAKDGKAKSRGCRVWSISMSDTY